jgi:hypothetical protein
MVAGNNQTIRHDGSRFSYSDACQVARYATASGGQGLVVVGLEQTCDTETAALARLVVLRRDLLRAGRDLRIAGLCGRANSLYEISRMAEVLPRT